MNFSDNSFLEVVDYNEPKINTLTPFSYIDTEETWDAMTDGMYGDMPDGFDDDYSFLGH